MLGMGSIVGRLAGGALSALLGRIGVALPDREKLAAGQHRANEAEISGAPASRLRLWRGFLGWMLALVFAWEVVGRSIISTYWPAAVLPPSALEEVSTLLLGMLGLGW